MLLPNPHLSPERQAYFRAYARRKIEKQREEIARARSVDAPAVSDTETAALNQRVRDATDDTLTWLQNHTETYNQHWKEEGRPTPFEPFPQKPYFRPVLDYLHAPGQVKAIAKSRDLMVTWTIMGYFTLEAMKVPSREILVQTMQQKKVVQCIKYAKCMYSRQAQWLKDAFPLAKPIEKMASNEFSLANGSVIWGVAGGADQLRSYHPWGYFNDETAFQTEAGISYDESLSAVQKIVLNSTAKAGWYFDWLLDSDGI